MADLNSDKSTLYVASPLYKQVTSGGQLVTYTDSDAITVAFQIWLTSGKGELLRSNSGGYLLPYLMKPLTNSTAQEIKRSIQAGLEDDFTPTLTIQTLEVIPDVKNSRWVIWLVAYNTALNLGVNATSIINSNL